MGTARTLLIGAVTAILLGLTVYSQSGLDPGSRDFSATEGLKALAAGYGTVRGEDPSIILTDEDEDW